MNICGFKLVNGKHCILNGHCIVCRAKETHPYDPKTYRLLHKEDIILYSPNKVSIRKKIISA